MARVTIPLERVTYGGGLKKTSVQILETQMLTLGYVTNLLKFKTSEFTLHYRRVDEEDPLIAEVEWEEGTEVIAQNIAHLSLRPKPKEIKIPTSKSSRLETLPSDTTQLNLQDLENEGVKREEVRHLTKSYDLKNPLLNFLKEILLTPIALPTDSKFEALLDAECIFPPEIPMADDSTVHKITIPEKDILLNLEGNEMEYYKYLVLVFKIREKMKTFFLDKEAPRSEGQWQASIYQPLFEATSLPGLVTGLNPLTIHSKVVNEAIATSKMRSFATGVRALKPDIADGFLAMNSNGVAYGSDARTMDISKEPFSNYKENEKVKLGDLSHLLLDTVVELKKAEIDLDQILAKVIGELAIISSVLQCVTKMNDLVTFGYSIARESVDLFVMHPLKPLPLTYKKPSEYKKQQEAEQAAKESALTDDNNSISERTRSSKSSSSKSKSEGSAKDKNKKEADASSEPVTKAEPRLQSTQLFHWDLKEDIEFFEFAIFLWRVRTFRQYQFDIFCDTLSNDTSTSEVEVEDTSVVLNQLQQPMANNNNNNSGGSSGEVPDFGASSSAADAMDVEYHPNVVDESKSCSNPKLLQCLSDHTRVKVFLATLDGQQMVVKRFSDDNLDLFEREQTIYKKLKGLPCVPRMISVPMENSFGLEYVRGVHYFTAETLKDVLQYMVLLLKAICDIHSRNVIHSDIKFANVIYDSTAKSLKVIDFAYSVQAEYKNGLQYCEGSTTHYAAPEVRNNTRVGFASDIYSAGMMFVSLLYGIKIVNEDDDKLFHQLVNRMENKFKSREASYIAQKMIARDWVQRSTAKELIDQILRIQPDITL